jgi:cyclophilin family peptidyl-prolyl cis-trans isomerase
MRAPVLALLLASACSRSAAPGASGAPDTHAEPPALYRLEALAEAATPQLITRSRDTLDALYTSSALRSLGRVGDPAAIAELLRVLADADPERRKHATAALGIAALLGSDVGDAEARLIDRWERAANDERIVLADALGRLGSAAALPVLRAGMQPRKPTALQNAAALALGRLGRREVAIDHGARARLVELATLSDTAYAAVYALANEHAPVADAAASKALLAPRRDRDTAIVARQGALRRLAGSPTRKCIFRGAPAVLGASDWDVPSKFLADDDERLFTAGLAHIAGEFPRGPLTTPAHLASARTLLDVLRCLGTPSKVALTPPRRDALLALRRVVHDAASASPTTPSQPAGATSSATSPADRSSPSVAQSEGATSSIIDPTAANATGRALARTLARIDCQIAAQLAHDPAWRPPLVCGDDALAPHERDVSTVGVLADGFGGTWPERQVLLTAALRHRDPQIRIAAVGAVARLWDEPAAAATVDAWILAALDDRVLGVIGAAADAVTARHKGATPPTITAEDPLWRSLAARARGAVDSEPELFATLVGTLAATKLPQGAALCSPALRHVNASVRAAARDCVKALTGADPGRQTPARTPPPPPLDPSRLQGKTVRWILHTDLGPLHVDLDPATAPWAVAMIVELTQRGFYDGLTFHRDVPGFVLQGGDPEGTGWGGPGFALPSEPSLMPYDRGAVGIADAGRDTGGSQFFFMHARAPHLEGRYTWVGRLAAEDLDRLELLTIEDRIRKAEVRITYAAPAAAAASQQSRPPGR